MTTMTDRFWQKVAKRSPEECWEWRAAVNKSGYGWMNIKSGESRPAHRVSALIHGLIDTFTSTLHVLHKCDNRKCCNPNHLFTGSNQDNVADRVKKSRNGFRLQLNESNGMCKLTNQETGLIRGLYFSASFSQSALAKKFGVQQSQISRIVTLVQRRVVS